VTAGLPGGRAGRACWLAQLGGWPGKPSGAQLGALTSLLPAFVFDLAPCAANPSCWLGSSALRNEVSGVIVFLCGKKVGIDVDQLISL
jgi:hypothetical protein